MPEQIRGSVRYIIMCVALMLAVLTLSAVAGCVTPTGQLTAAGPDWEAVQQCISEQRYDDAIAMSDRIVAANPNSAGGYYFRGVAHYLKGNRAAAEADLGRCIAINPKDANCLAQRAILYARYKEYERSLADFNQAIANGLKGNITQVDKQGRGQFYVNNIFAERAQVHMQLKQYDAALRDMDQAISIDPNNAGHYLMKSGFLLQMARPDEAFAAARTASERKPDHPTPFNLMGLAAFYRGDFARSIQYYNRGIDLYRQNNWELPQILSAIHCNRAFARWQSGLQSAALADIREAVSLAEASQVDGGQAVLYLHLGFLLHETGDRAQAKAEFKKALEIDPQLLNSRMESYAPLYALNPANLDLLRKELRAVAHYLGTDFPALEPVRALTPQLTITQLQVQPNPVAAGAPFDIRIDYHLSDPQEQKALAPMTLRLEILQDDKTIFRSQPIDVRSDRQGDNVWAQHMNPSTARGRYRVKADLVYQEMTAQQITDFAIE